MRALIDDLRGRACASRRRARRPARARCAGKTFVLTGTLPDLTREQATERITARRRQGHRLGVQEDRLRRRRRLAGLQAREGRAARRDRCSTRPGCSSSWPGKSPARDGRRSALRRRRDPEGVVEQVRVGRRARAIKLDRLLFSSLGYPTDYGFFRDTLAADGDPLDAMVVVSEPTFPGCLIEVKPVALFRMRDENAEDNKILCVPLTDPNWSHIETLDDLPMSLRDEISHFFSIYKTPDWKVVKVDGWYPTRGGARVDRARLRALQGAVRASSARARRPCGPAARRAPYGLTRFIRIAKATRAPRGGLAVARERGDVAQRAGLAVAAVARRGARACGRTACRCGRRRPARSSNAAPAARSRHVLEQRRPPGAASCGRSARGPSRRRPAG